MIKRQAKAAAFKKLHVPGRPLVLFNIWDAGSAKAVEASGAKAIATSSWAVARAYGFQDGEHIPLTLALENLRRIVHATELPVTVDLESGYGGKPELVGKAVALAIEAGAVGCNLEDSFPSDGRLRKAEDQSRRIRAAREAASASRGGFFINARADVFYQKPAKKHDDAMVSEAIDRAHVYAEAGADCLFVPGLVNLDLIARLAKKSPLPVNVLDEDGSLRSAALAARGVARVSYGALPYARAMEMLEEAARAANANKR